MGIIQDAVNSTIGATAKVGAVVKGAQIAKEQEKNQTIREGEGLLKEAQGIAEEKPRLEEQYNDYANYNLDLEKSDVARREITAKKEALRKQLDYLNERNKFVEKRIESFNKKASKFNLDEIGGINNGR
jgi:DNA repair exonuclease SbcCD ATPase subunit